MMLLRMEGVYTKAVNPVLEQILQTQQVESSSGEKQPLHSHVSGEEGEFLQRLIRHARASVTLEIGFAFGISTLFICDALRETGGERHIVLDPYQFTAIWGGIGVSQIRAAGFDDLVDFREQPSHQVLPELEAEGVTVDFAFIDGCHTFDHSVVDFFLVDRILRVGGIVAIDDAQWPSVRKACRFIATNRRYRVLDCLGEGEKLRFRPARRLLSQAAMRLNVVRKLLRTELALPDDDLDLRVNSRCVAFIKEADDDRQSFEYEPF